MPKRRTKRQQIPSRFLARSADAVDKLLTDGILSPSGKKFNIKLSNGEITPILKLSWKKSPRQSLTLQKPSLLILFIVT
jgi:hypothetical protein